MLNTNTTPFTSSTACLHISGAVLPSGLLICTSCMLLERPRICEARMRFAATSSATSSLSESTCFAARMLFSTSMISRRKLSVSRRFTR